MNMKGLNRVKSGVKRLLPFYLLTFLPLSAGAQQMLSLDSCRAMALRNNKQMGVNQLKQEVAANLRKSARTKYLPHISAIGTYQYTSEEVSILNNEQKGALSNLGTNAMTKVGTMAAQMGYPLDALAQQMPQLAQGLGTATDLLNNGGQKIVDALRTDTRNIFAGTIMVTQPVFLGGSITALNRIADLNEQMTKNSSDAQRQAILYSTDQTYWQVVSLKHKQRLAQSYLDLIKKFDSDVQKMIEEGVATKSDGLSVSVKVNEAEMTLQKVNDGLELSKMLLCQMVGLPMDEAITLADEDSEDLGLTGSETPVSPISTRVSSAIENRPELKMLENTVDISKQATNVLKAGNLPMVALTGGYVVSNPNMLDGFEKKFGGFWNVGVLVRVPLWNWGDVAYKVRASKGVTAIANLELQEAREKIELQVNQNTFRVNEANKKLTMAQSSIVRADENLRTANLGFQEGVISPTTVMEAQTAWLQAQSQKIDAEIDVRLSQVDLQKSLGILE